MTAPLTSLARKRLHKCGECAVIIMYHQVCSVPLLYLTAVSISAVAAVTLASSIHDAAVEGDAATLARLLPSATPAHLGYEAKVRCIP